jgi:hypothetical protein
MESDMSEYHRPTLTFPDKLYNATQVRLYGIKPPSLVFSTTSPAEIPHKNADFSTKIASTFANASQNTNVKNDIDKLRKSKKSEEEIYQELQTKYPNDLSSFGKYSYLDIDTKEFGEVYVSIYSDANKKISCGVIVGYSYEGHCYDLPKPKIMFLNVDPQEIPNDDCGYSIKKNNYMVWLVDKLSNCVEFEMNQGFVEQIVLEANLPGKRAPTMYAGRMMMGHRSGRLSE